VPLFRSSSVRNPEPVTTNTAGTTKSSFFARKPAEPVVVEDTTKSGGLFGRKSSVPQTNENASLNHDGTTEKHGLLAKGRKSSDDSVGTDGRMGGGHHLFSK
jgi:hypothetical protein